MNCCGKAKPKKHRTTAAKIDVATTIEATARRGSPFNQESKRNDTPNSSIRTAVDPAKSNLEIDLILVVGGYQKKNLVLCYWCWW
ncbi:hypothetical protein Droror1_Dr00020096 [Drosera rotundifolia]